MSAILDRFKNFPKAAPYIVVTETAERFSFYGMKAILSTFLIAQFFNPANNPALAESAEARPGGHCRATAQPEAATCVTSGGETPVL